MGASWIAIVWAGFAATVLSAAVFWLFRSLELTEFSPTGQLGCLIVREPNVPLTETVGFLLFLGLGVTIVPLLYIGAFAVLGGPGWAAGILAGTVHGTIVAAALPVLERVSPCVRDGRVPPPGPFGLRWGRLTPLAVATGHAAYGAVVGGVLRAF